MIDRTCHYNATAAEWASCQNPSNDKPVTIIKSALLKFVLVGQMVEDKNKEIEDICQFN